MKKDKTIKQRFKEFMESLWFYMFDITQDIGKDNYVTKN